MTAVPKASRGLKYEGSRATKNEKGTNTMKIEEILTNAGITDQTIIDAIKAEMPKSFMPLADANKRIGDAKQAAAEATTALDTLKGEVEAAKQAAEAKGTEGADEAAKALEELQKSYDTLKSDFVASQDAMKQRDAMDALASSLQAAGANPAAITLLANNALSRVEYGEDGKPANVQDVTETIKTDNAGLFGEPVETGKQQTKADSEIDTVTAFDEGFGETKRN